MTGKRIVVFIVSINEAATKMDELVSSRKKAPAAVHYGFLAYNDGRGPIRTYIKDCCDPRLSLGGKKPPYFDDHSEAVQWMWQNKGEPCQVNAKLYRRFGLKKNELAEEVEEYGPVG